MSLTFFNHFHNGDIYHAKEFVRDVAEQLDVDVYFAHNYHSILVSDLPRVGYGSASWFQFSPKDRLIKDEHGNLFVNTHIGAWFGTGLKYDTECSLRFNMEMWKVIYQALSEAYNKPLVLKDINHYIPSINFSKFDLKRIQNFVMEEKRKKVLICNGPVHSGQAIYNEDMSHFVRRWAQEYPNTVFILTMPVDFGRMQNVCYTNEIIDLHRTDLNEIGYLSTHCDLIIGRNSGPYCFTVNKDNVSDPKKTFFSFGKSETDCFMLGVPTEATMLFHKEEDLASLTKALDKVVFDIS